MQHRLSGLRGKAFVAKYKQILAEEGEAISSAYFAEVEASGDKFTPMSLGRLANKLRLPLSILDDCLPELTGYCYSSGTWDRLKDRGCKAKDIGVVWQ
jgi:hypothetical protein